MTAAAVPGPAPPRHDGGFAAATAALAAGGMAVLDTGTEAHLVQAAASVTAADVAFMAIHARGLVCVALTPARCDALGIEPVPVRGGARKPFMVSIEARDHVATGISAADRARTIRVAVDPASGPRDLVRPGHVFPLRASAGGVLERPGAAEAAIELATAAGAGPAAVLCGVLDDAGDVAAGGALRAFARTHGLALVALEAVVATTRERRPELVRIGAAPLPAAARAHTAVLFRSRLDGTTHTALVVGDPSAADAAPAICVACAGDDAPPAPGCGCGCGDALDDALARLGGSSGGLVLHLPRAASARADALVAQVAAELATGAGR